MIGTIAAVPGRPGRDLAPLDSVGWLAGESPEFVAWAAAAGRWRRFRAGQYIYRAGDPAEGVYGLAEGALEVTFPLVSDEPVTIHRAEVGFWIGDSALLSETPRLISISAAVDSRVFHIPNHALLRLLREEPGHWRAFYRLTARNFEVALRLLSESLALTVRARVCRRLLALAGADGDVQITQHDLATLVGVTRTTLQRALSALSRAGGVERRYGKVIVTDPDVLRRYVDEQ
jgi:CRP-like cAMP-binding protein